MSEFKLLLVQSPLVIISDSPIRNLRLQTVVLSSCLCFVIVVQLFNTNTSILFQSSPPHIFPSAPHGLEMLDISIPLAAFVISALTYHLRITSRIPPSWFAVNLTFLAFSDLQVHLPVQMLSVSFVTCRCVLLLERASQSPLPTIVPAAYYNTLQTLILVYILYCVPHNFIVIRAPVLPMVR